VSSPFQVETRGKSYSGICIWDALGTVAALGMDATSTPAVVIVKRAHDAWSCIRRDACAPTTRVRRAISRPYPPWGTGLFVQWNHLKSYPRVRMRRTRRRLAWRNRLSNWNLLLGLIS